LGKGMELEAVSLTKDFSKFIHPNKLLIELADSILNREGQMKLTAYEFYKF
jgi:predicted protein tyrosine phosphatase